MSTNYSVQQYNQEFAPKRLQMHEIPKDDLSQRAQQRNNEIVFIANERGHLLSGVGKGSTNPFGDFVGTWDLPKSIPGPYQITKTGRSHRNVEMIYEKKKETEKAIELARENQKPMSMRKIEDVE